MSINSHLERLNSKLQKVTGLTLKDLPFVEVNEFIVLDQYLDWIQSNTPPPTATKSDLLAISKELNTVLCNYYLFLKRNEHEINI